MDAELTRAGRAWVLNLDADDELADPSRSTRSKALQERLRELARRLDRLVPEGDLVLGEGDRADGLAGRCFCPTPRALATLRRAGARLPAAPPVDALRAVNHRRFCADLGQTLPRARFVTAEDEALALLASLAAGGPWLLKRAFGFAGRGQLRVSRELAESERRWLRASIAQGGLQIEPLVDRDGDFGLHGFLEPTGALTLGAPTRQACDARGAWQGSELARPGSLAPEEERTLFEAAETVAAALHHAGYFGPFGVDAFRYRDGARLAWNPRSEVNARYSMGWAIGMGSRRPDLVADCAARRLDGG